MVARVCGPFSEGIFDALCNYSSVFLLIIVAEKLNFGALTFGGVHGYTFFLLFLTFLIGLLYQELGHLKQFQPAAVVSFLLTTLIYVIPLFYITYCLNFDSKISDNTLYAVSQTNLSESLEYISDFISVGSLVLFFSGMVLIALLLFLQGFLNEHRIGRGFLLASLIVPMSAGLAFVGDLSIPAHITNAFISYQRELSLFQRVQEARKAGTLQLTASKRADGETYVVVIGESLSKKHMGIYGYFRNTKRLLSKMIEQDSTAFLVFANAYSNHTHTVTTMQLALTEANQYNNKSFSNSMSIVDILDQANFETYWITNPPIYRIYGNAVSVIAKTADHLISLNKAIGTTSETTSYDGALITELEKILATDTRRNRAIFVHLICNHVRYDKRYPKENTPFSKASWTLV